MFSPGDLVKVQTDKTSFLGYVLDWDSYSPKNPTPANLELTEKLKEAGFVPVHIAVGEAYATALARPELVTLVRHKVGT